MKYPCRFFIQGYCKNGSNCPFLHPDVTRDQHGNVLKTFKTIWKEQQIIDQKIGEYQQWF